MGLILFIDIPIENGLKLLFNFSLEYAITKAQETNLGLGVNCPHKILAYAEDLSLIDDVIRTTERNEDVLLNALRVLV